MNVNVGIPTRLHRRKGSGSSSRDAERKKQNQPQQEWHASNRITNIILFMRSERCSKRKKNRRRGVETESGKNNERFFGYDFILRFFTNSQLHNMNYWLDSSWKMILLSSQTFSSVCLFEEKNFNHALSLPSPTTIWYVHRRCLASILRFRLSAIAWCFTVYNMIIFGFSPEKNEKEKQNEGESAQAVLTIPVSAALNSSNWFGWRCYCIIGKFTIYFASVGVIVDHRSICMPSSSSIAIKYSFPTKRKRKIFHLNWFYSSLSSIPSLTRQHTPNRSSYFSFWLRIGIGSRLNGARLVYEMINLAADALIEIVKNMATPNE